MSDEQPGREPHIQRCHDSESWLVVCHRLQNPVRREFPDKLFGGASRGLSAARNWRDAQPWYMPADVVAGSPRVDEVRRYESQLPGNPHVSAFWYASWVDPQGKRWSRKFSVAFWGEEVARQKAMDVRAAYERKLAEHCRASS